MASSSSPFHDRPQGPSSDDVDDDLELPASKRRRREAENGTQGYRQELVDTTIQDQARAHIGNNLYAGAVYQHHHYGGAIPTSSGPGEDSRRRAMDLLEFGQMESRYLTIAAAHAKTCRWLFGRAEYKAWRDPAQMSSHHGFFWLKGKPGAGKSTLMKSAFMHAKKTFRGSKIVSFFFNARGSALESNTEGMYRSVLHQLLTHLPRLQAVFDTRRFAGNFEQTWPMEVLKELFREAVASLGEDSLTCYIDALDECDEDEVRNMLEFFEELGEASVQDGINFQIFFSSRHYPHITIQNHQELILEGQEGHEQDIADYIRSRLKIKGALLQQLKDAIQTKASGVFLWVVLVVRILNEENDRGNTHLLRQRLRDIPSRLSELFEDMLNRGSKDQDALALMLQWVLYAKRPLKCEELYFAVMSGIDVARAMTWKQDGVTPEDMERFVIDRSKGLAELTKGKVSTVQFIHESVRDYLRSAKLEVIKAVGISHDRLKHCCQDYMSAQALQETLPQDLPKANSVEAYALREEKTQAFPFLEYAVGFMLHHADTAQECGIEQGTFVQDFAHTGVTGWAALSNLFEKHQIRRYTDGVTALYILVEKKLSNLLEVGIKRLLLSQIDSPTLGLERYETPLGAAIALDYTHGVQLLLSEGVYASSNVKWVGKRRSSYLLLAIEKGCLDVVRLLLLHGADPNHSEWGETPLRVASRKDSKEIVQILLHHGADVNVLDGNGETPLGIALAADLYHEGLAQLLPLKGADIDKKTDEGGTQQGTSYKAGHESVVQLLLANGADVNVVHNRGETLLARACKEGREDLVQLLLDRGANVNARSQDHDGTALQVASTYGYTDIVLLLLDRGADVNAPGGYYGTALQAACVCGYENTVSLLLDKGADVNTPGGYGTALQAACLYGHENTVSLLLDKGADVNTPGGGYGTALQAASLRGHEGIVQLLLSRGATHINTSSAPHDLERAIAQI